MNFVPLHWAVSEGNLFAVRSLVTAKAMDGTAPLVRLDMQYEGSRPLDVGDNLLALAMTSSYRRAKIPISSCQGILLALLNARFEGTRQLGANWDELVSVGFYTRLPLSMYRRDWCHATS